MIYDLKRSVDVRWLFDHPKMILFFFFPTSSCSNFDAKLSLCLLPLWQSWKGQFHQRGAHCTPAQVYSSLTQNNIHLHTGFISFSFAIIYLPGAQVPPYPDPCCQSSILNQVRLMSLRQVERPLDALAVKNVKSLTDWPTHSLKSRGASASKNIMT